MHHKGPAKQKQQQCQDSNQDSRKPRSWTDQADEFILGKRRGQKKRAHAS